MLDQERIHHQPVEGPDAPVTVFEGALPGWVEDYVAGGGVAVVSGAVGGDGFVPEGRVASGTGFVPPGATDRCWAPGLVTLLPGEGAGELRLHEDRVPKYGTDPDRHPAVVVVRRGRGAVVASGVPLTALLSAPGDRLRRFAPFSPVTERVTSVDKADVADTLLWMVREAFAAAALPLVVVPRFPNGAPSVLILRIDVDGVYGGNTMALSSVAEAEDVAMSFFVNADLSQRYAGPLGPWPPGVEVGQHGYTHSLYDTVEDNVVNLSRAERWMEESFGVRPVSFVAPRGLWNWELGKALASRGYRYSSDFGLDQDSLPYRSDAGVLQVPVHPYSPERAVVWAEEQGITPPTPDDVLRHYLSALERQLSLGRPAHLYGHPEVLGRMAADVLPPLVRRARELGLPDLTLGQYADFWLEREALRPVVTLERAGGVVHVQVNEASLPIDVTTPSEVELVVDGHSRGRLYGRASIAVQ